MQEESSLFQIRLNEQGIKFIRKFAAISYTMMVLVFFGSAISIYWNIKILVGRPAADDSGYFTTAYDKVYPYISIAFSVLALISNFFYMRFPRVLLRSIQINDEFGANQAFRSLFKSALIFLIWLVLDSVSIIWSVISR